MFTKSDSFKVCLLIAIVGQAGSTPAQTYVSPLYNELHGAAQPLPPELGLAIHHSATVLEGALRGQSQLTHARGSYLLAHSQALVYREHARALALTNRQRWVDYQDARRNRRAEQWRLRTAEQRRTNESRRPAKFTAYHLQSNQFDRESGAIAWVPVLQGPEYANLRGSLNVLFADFARNAAIPPAEANEIVKYTNRLRDELRLHRGSLDRGQYLAAQKFLCGLAYEAQSRVYSARSENRLTTGLSSSSAAETAASRVAPLPLN